MGLVRGGRAEKRESRGKRACSLTLAAMLIVSPLVAFVSLLTFAPAVAASGVDSAIAGGGIHSLAIRSDGTVWAWGRNLEGQLGDGTTTNRSTPVQVSGIENVTAIAGGGYYSLAIRSDGTVWAWGNNFWGQLGDGTTTTRTTPVQVSGIENVTAIAAGWDHSLALRSDGTVWAWGYNGDGQLGDGTTTNRSTPVQVSGIENVTAIAGGDEHSLALRSDGTAWAWGRNYYGQLGDGTTTDENTPVQVSGLIPSTQVWFEWGLTTSYGNSTPQQTMTATGIFNASISGLSEVTTYHFRACASNPSATVYGSDQTFTTPPEWAVSISPNYQSGLPGTTLEYIVTVTNIGENEDNFDLTVSDSENWGPTLDDYRFENIPPGENRLTTLGVIIPENAVPSTEDNITVTATSQENVEVSDSASCIAHAAQVGLIPRAPIYIDGNDNFTPANGVVGGSGTENDPYIIENWDISAGSANGIEIRNTTAYFIIRNSNVHGGRVNSKYGIYLNSVRNGKVDNVVSENNYGGIYLYSSDNNLISNNLVENNRWVGIGGGNSDNNLISNNILENNDYGIYLGSSNNNLISNNLVENNYDERDKGIYLRWSDNNYVSNNIVGNNYFGIQLYESDKNLVSKNFVANNEFSFYIGYSHINLVENNLVENNREGIYLYFSFNNLISNNAAENNYYGVSLQNSNTNLIENCTLKNNGSGIHLGDSDNNLVTNNLVENNRSYGIHLRDSDNNLVTNNLVENHRDGIYLDYGSNNTLRGNVLRNNAFGFQIYGSALDHYRQDIDNSNTIDGKPIYYLIGESNLVFDGSFEVGFLGLVESENIRAENLQTFGILLAATSNSTVANSTITRAGRGIHLFQSRNNLVTNNLVENNLVGNNDYYGIYLSYSDNNLVENNTAENNYEGIYLYYSDNNFISNNLVENNNYGIRLYDSSYNTLDNNACSNNNGGIQISYSSNNNTLDNNTCSNNSRYGIRLSYSSNNTLSNNTCENNRYNFGVEGSDISHFDHDIDTSNLVDGRPIYYLRDNSDAVIGPSLNVGYLGLLRCDNIKVENLVLENNDQGIFLAFTENSWIENCTFSNNDYYGIYLSYSDNNTLANNTCENNNQSGIRVSHSINNTLDNNTCSNNSDYGIYLYNSSNDNLINNTCSNNSDYGIYLYNSSNNTLRNNTCSNNDYGIGLSVSDNNTLTNNTSRNNGAYGIRLSSSDNNTLSNNTCENNGYSIYLYNSSNDNLINNTCSNNDYGIYLSSLSSNNTLFHNYLLNNTDNNAYDSCSNYWDNGSDGNYWSDWQPPEHPDADNDRVVDEPRPILGGNNQDNFPLVIGFPLPRAVKVSISPDYQENLPGGTLSYTVTITNKGNIEDSYSLTVEDSAGWGPTLSDNLLEIPAGGEKNVMLTVTIPEDAENGDSMTTTVSARSEEDPSVTGSDTCTTIVTGVPVVENLVGVKAGDWIKYDYTISGVPAGTLPTWIKLEFLSVEGTSVTVRVTMHMTDGTESSETITEDVVAGGEISGLVIPANSKVGDSINMTGYGTVTIAGETSGTYAGASRTVVHASISQYGTQLTYYWDKQTGVMVEASVISGDLTATVKATETNIWQVEKVSWDALIAATFSGGSDDAVFGVRPDATPGFDNAYDIPEPPPPVAPPYVRTFFYYPEQTPDELHRSCLAPENLMEWPLRIEYADNIEDITLMWSVENIPSEYFVLLYRGGGLVADMRTEENYTFEASTGSYDFRIVVGKLLPFTLELAQGWNMISFSVLPEDSSPDAIFDGYYVLYRWDAEDKRYMPHADSGSFIEPDPDVEVGVGYWVYVLEDENVNLLGVPVNQLFLGLRQGWNLIGPPYGGSSIADPADDPDNSVIPWAFTWNAEERSYRMTQLLEAGKGYWVYTLRYCSLTLPPKEPRKCVLAIEHFSPIAGTTWSGAHDRAAKRLCEKYPSLEYVYREEIGPDLTNSTAEELIATEGADIVVGNAEFMGMPLADIAADYPDVYFVSIIASDLTTKRNFIRYFPRQYQALYLEGLIAGALTETGNIGIVSAFPCVQVCRRQAGFYLGIMDAAEALGKDITLYVKYVGDWYLPTEEAEIARTLIDTYNCDVITQQTDSGSPLDVVEEKGVWFVGKDMDIVGQYGWSSVETVAVSFDTRWEVGYEMMIKDWMSGETNPETILYPGMDDKIILADGTVYPTVDIQNDNKVGIEAISPYARPLIDDRIVELVENRREQMIGGSWDPFFVHELRSNGTGLELPGLPIPAEGTVVKPANEVPSDEWLLSKFNFDLEGIVVLE